MAEVAKERLVRKVGSDHITCRVLESCLTEKTAPGTPFIYDDISSEYRLSLMNIRPHNRLDDVAGQICFPSFADTRPVPVTSLVFRPGNVHLRSFGDRPRSQGYRIQLAFSEEYFTELTGHEGRWTLKELEAAASLGRMVPIIGLYLRQIGKEVIDDRFGSYEAVEALSNLALIELARYFRQVDRDHDRTMASAHLRIIYDRIRDPMASFPQVSELADLCGISARHLLRLFKAQTGTTLVSFIRDVRLARAQYLVGQTEQPLKQIAYNLGFSNQASFAGSFNASMGTTPAQYRRELRRQFALPKAAPAAPRKVASPASLIAERSQGRPAMSGK